MAKSPAVIFFDINGNPMAVEDGIPIPAGTSAIVVAGSDGSDAHFVLVDSNGRPIVAGAGVAGTPAGGVLSIQGVVGGTSIPISGTVSATNASTGTNNTAVPSSSTQIGGSDGTNLQSVRVFDADTGAGTQYVLGAVVRKSASGGSVEAGTATDPFRVDTTGTTTQPISAVSLPLPTGCATETTLATRLAEATFTSRINTLGQKTAANSTPVILASDQSAIPVTDNSGSLTVDSSQLPAALVGARLDTNNGAWLGSTAPTVGSKTSANSVPVVIASDQGAVAISGTVTSNIGTSGALALDSTLTGGTQKAIVRGGAKGATTAADVTSTAEGTDHQALDIQVYHSGTAINPTAIRALTSTDVVTVTQGTAVALSGRWPVQITDGTNTMPTADTVARSSFHRVTDGTNTATVKAASTAAVAADPALVVAISPNNTITTSNASVGSINAALPTSATEIGGSDGTNLQVVRVFDGDTGGGTQYVLGTILRKSASGGTVEAGTSADPLRIDPTGTTTQPISAASLPLPTGASTEATLATRLADSTFTGRINTLGQKTSANSTPVVFASDQSSVPVTDAGGSLTVDGTVTSNQGTAAALSGRWPVQVTDGTNIMPVGDVVGRALFQKITDGTNTSAVKAASTAAVAGDPALVVAVSPNNNLVPDVSASGTASALNSALGLTIAGRNSVSTQLTAGTLIGTVIPEVSFDNGATYVGSTSYFVNPVTLIRETSLVFASSNPTVIRGIYVPSGASQIRLRVSAYTSGSAVWTMRTVSAASTARDELGPSGSPVPPGTLQVGGSDGTNLRMFSTDSGGRPVVRIGDGTNTVEVKAASTAALAADPALVVAISPNNALSVSAPTSTTPSQSSVAGSASSVQLLASNASRKGATLFNDSSVSLYVRLGTTASTTNFTVRLDANDYYEVPFGYTGRIDGIWASAAGNCRITELT